jgi:hypothetical protein
MKNDPSYKTLNQTGKMDAEKELKTGGTVELEEEQLDEMAYNIVLSNPEKLAKLKDEIKDSPKAGKKLLYQVIDIIQRDKKENKPIRQRDIANELGIIQQKINPLVNLLIDYGILDKGESVTGVTKKAPSDKPKKEKPESTGKRGRPASTTSAPKKATLTKGDDGFDDVTYSEPEGDEAAAAVGSDETAKELGKAVPKDKIEKFNMGLKFIKKYKDDKKIIDAYLKKAKDEYKLPANMIKDLKKAAGREVEI